MSKLTIKRPILKDSKRIGWLVLESDRMLSYGEDRLLNQGIEHIARALKTSDKFNLTISTEDEPSNEHGKRG